MPPRRRLRDDSKEWTGAGLRYLTPSSSSLLADLATLERQYKYLQERFSDVASENDDLRRANCAAEDKLTRDFDATLKRNESEYDKAMAAAAATEASLRSSLNIAKELVRVHETKVSRPAEPEAEENR